MSDEEHSQATQPHTRTLVRFDEGVTRPNTITEDNVPAGTFMYLGRATPKDEDDDQRSNTPEHTRSRPSPLILWAHFSFDSHSPDFPHRRQCFAERFQECIFRTLEDETLSEHHIEWSNYIGQVAVVVPPRQVSRPRSRGLPQPRVMAYLLPCERATRPYLEFSNLATDFSAVAAEEPWYNEREYSARAISHFEDIMHLQDPYTTMIWREVPVTTLRALQLATEEHVETQVHRAREKIQNHWRDIRVVRSLQHHVHGLLPQRTDGSEYAADSDKVNEFNGMQTNGYVTD